MAGMGGSGATMLDSIFKYADMVHDNMNQSFAVGNQIAQTRNQRMQLDEQKNQFDKRFGLESMMARQQHQMNQSNMNWQKSFRDVLRGA